MTRYRIELRATVVDEEVEELVAATGLGMPDHGVAGLVAEYEGTVAVDAEASEDALALALEDAAGWAH